MDTNIPCKDCITLPICLAEKNSPYERVIVREKLEKKCSLLKEYMFEFNGIVLTRRALTRCFEFYEFFKM